MDHVNSKPSWILNSDSYEFRIWYNGRDHWNVGTLSDNGEENVFLQTYKYVERGLGPCDGVVWYYYSKKWRRCGAGDIIVVSGEKGTTYNFLVQATISENI